MDGNNLSFGITARNGATTALNALQRQVTSLKNGLQSLANTKIDTSSTTRFINSLNSNISKTSKGLGSLGRSVTSTIATFGGFKLVNSMFNTITGTLDRALTRIDTMDLFDQKITMITGNANEASQALEHLKTSTKGTPYALDIAAKAVQNFVTRGMATQKATESVDIWMDAVSAYGKGTNEQFESVLDAIGKMRTKGTVEMRYLNRLFAAGINPVQMYAKATGMAAEDVQSALTNKEIKTDEFLNVVETAMREGTNGVIKVAGKAKELAGTWAATIANMQTAIARGWAEFLKGSDSLFNMFNEKGLKGIFKQFGESVEDGLTRAGQGVTTIMNRLKAAYQVSNNMNLEQFNRASTTLEQNSKAVSENFKQAKDTFNGAFTQGMSPYMDDIMTKFTQLRVAWSNVELAFSKGVERISAPLARLASEYLGTTVTSAEDLFIAFSNWLSLKLPVFFEKLENALNWLIDHKDGVLSATKSILTGLLAFNALASIKNVIVGFNNSLKNLNDILAFFTLGKVQLPTIENLVSTKAERQNERLLEQIKQENELKQKRNTLETVYNNNANKVKTQTARDLSNLDKSQIRDEIKVSTAHKKESNKLVENRTKAEDKLKQDRSKQISSLDASYLAGTKKADTVYDTEIDRINKTKQQDTVRILKSQQTSLQKTKKNGASSSALLKQYGIDLTADYATPKIMSQSEIEKNSKIFDQIYEDMKANNISPNSSPVLTDIYNSRTNANLLKQQAATKRETTKTNLLEQRKTGIQNIDIATTNGLNKVETDYTKNLEALNKNTKDQMTSIRTSYGYKKKDVNLGSEKKLADIKTAYDVGIKELDAPIPKKQGGFFNWVKNGYTEAKTGISTGVKNVGSGTRDFFGTMFKGFKDLSIQDKTKIPTSSIPGKIQSGGKSVLSGAGEFLGTMFSGFGNLGKGAKATVALEGTEQAVQQGGALTKVLETLKGAFTTVLAPIKAAGSAVLSFVGTFGGITIAVVGATAAIGALTAGLGMLNPGNALSDGITQFFTSFGDLCTSVAENAPTVVQGFVQKIKDNLPKLSEQGVNLILSLVNGILVGIPKVLTAGVSVLMSLITGLVQVLPDLVQTGFTAIGQFISGIIKNLPNILSAAWELVKTLALGIVRNVPIIIASAIKLMGSIVTGIWSMMTQIGTALKDTVLGGIQYMWEHRGEIWDSIKNFCGELANAFWDGVWTGLDAIGAGGFVEWLGFQRPEAQKAAEELGAGASDAAAKEIQENAQKFQGAWDNVYGQITQNTDQANAAGNAAGQAVVDGANTALDQGLVDAETAGVDTADAYTDAMTEEMLNNSADVDTAISGIGSEGLANISVNFNSEEVAQAGAGLINTLTGAVNDNAFTLYQAIAVVCSNALTQLQAGFAVIPDDVANSIATGMTAVAEQVSMKVTEICNNIKTNLTTAKDEADAATQELSTAIQNNFNTAQISTLASLEGMKTGVIQKYDELKGTVESDIGAIESIHTSFSTDSITNFKNTISDRLGEVTGLYNDLSDNIKDSLSDLITYHAGAANNMMTAFIEGLRARKSEAATVEGEIVQTLKDTFEKGLGIHSPSQYGQWVGNMFVLGLINGVTNDKLTRLLDNSINAMQESFKNGNFNADATVNFLSKDGVVNLIGRVGDVTTEDAEGGQIAYPLAGGTYPITSYFGLRDQPTAGASTDHGALDFGAPYGTSIKAIQAGTVTTAGWYGGYGNAVVVNHGNGLESLYGHMSAVGTTVGAQVQKGQTIGQVGSTGVSTGAHLHLGIYQNGTAIDPLPYIEGASLSSIKTLKEELQNAYDKKYNPEAYAARMAGLNAATSNGTNGGSTQNVENWRATVNQALQMLGLSTSFADGILATMEAESGGNPMAINDWDDNWYRGTPSLGLMQVIQPTFDQYALEGYNTNIYDPLSNILASIRYQLAAYAGDLSAKLSGYAVGTRYVPQDMLAMIHEGEAIIPANQNPYSQSGGDYLSDMFSSIFESDLSGFNIDPMTTAEGGTETDNSFNFNGNIVFNVTNNNDADGDRFVGNLESELYRILNDGFRSKGV